MDIEEIRELAGKFSPEQIEGCITQQIETGENIYLRDESTEKVVNELSKAQFVRELMAQGVGMPDAIRELARRIRRVQKGFEG
jgi:methyl coenzyme M reductase subunit D